MPAGQRTLQIRGSQLLAAPFEGHGRQHLVYLRLPPEFRHSTDATLPEAAVDGGDTMLAAATLLAGATANPTTIEGDWLQLLAREVSQRLAAGETGIIDDLTARFESTCIKTGLAHTGGRKVEAAQLLGWGRNTLTRKIQELGLEHD